MASHKRWIQKLVDELVDQLSKRYDIHQVIVFGSYAWGKPTQRSDLDLAVISPSFNRMNDIERLVLLNDCARSITTPRPMGIDVIGFTPQEFRRAGYYDLAGEIKERGVVVYKRAA